MDKYYIVTVGLTTSCLVHDEYFIDFREILYIVATI